MDRFFRPVGGFLHQPVKELRLDDDGMTYEVLNDNSERFVGSTNQYRQAVPMWNAEELDRLVLQGKWEEIKREPAPVAKVARPEPKRDPAFTSKIGDVETK